MDIFLIHGMGRTPISMWLLGRRLKRAGYCVHLVGYVAAVESLDKVTQRLLDRIARHADDGPYALVGHSLGSVIIRRSLVQLMDPNLKRRAPVACFFIAGPLLVSKVAQRFHRYFWYKLLFGEMGQLLASADFMQSLPMHPHTYLYAGTAGPLAAWWPSGGEPNDGVLTVAEASANFSMPVTLLPATHTFIMNRPSIAEDIHRKLQALRD